MDSEEFLRDALCTVCHVTVMEPHPELSGWYKCQLCGFSKKNSRPEPMYKIIDYDSSKK